jgi:hypothetical protein
MQAISHPQDGNFFLMNTALREWAFIQALNR